MGGFRVHGAAGEEEWHLCCGHCRRCWPGKNTQNFNNPFFQVNKIGAHPYISIVNFWSLIADMSAS